MDSPEPPPRRPPSPQDAPTEPAAQARVPRAPERGGNVPPAYGEPAPPYGEPLPPEDPTWRVWPNVVLAALATLIIGFVVGLLIGKSSSSNEHTGNATATRTVTTHGATHTTTVTTTVVHTQTHTVTAAAPAEGGGEGKSFTGTGNSRVGTLTVSEKSTIHWRSSGGFSIKNSSEDEHSLAFTSTSSNGERPVEPGTYHEVTVTAPGQWSFTISPG